MHAFAGAAFRMDWLWLKRWLRQTLCTCVCVCVCVCCSHWIYPAQQDKPVREYQFKLVQSALFSNTLVCLPTGLGKTFIAAVVMVNHYRYVPCSACAL